MKATKAYIASLGTTGVLLGASLLMLAVVSAVVAFDRWPDGQVSSRVQTLVLSDKPAPIKITDRTAASAVAPRAAAPLAIAGPRVTTGAPTVAGKRFTGGRNPVVPVTTKPNTPATPSLPKTPPIPSPDSLPDLISNPGTTASQVADGAQSVTDTAGVSLGKISPDLGTTVAATGQAAAQTIRQLPLPGHIIPGH